MHTHGITSDKMCKRYLFMLDMIVKSKVQTKKKPTEGAVRNEGGPPKMLYLRELFAALGPGFRGRIAERVS